MYGQLNWNNSIELWKWNETGSDGRLLSEAEKLIQYMLLCLDKARRQWQITSKNTKNTLLYQE